MKKIFSLLVLTFLLLSVGFGQTTFDPYPLQPVVWDSLGSPPASVSYFAEKDGRLWVANGNLFFSDDDGLTWKQHPQFAFNDVDKVFASDHGITITRRKLAGCIYINQCSQFLIYLSTDGGETFTESETAPYYKSYSTHSYSNSPGVIKKSESEFIFYIISENNLNRGILFYNSLDGGLTWKAIEMTEYHAFYSSEVTFFQDENALSSIYTLTDFVWRFNIHTDDYSNFDAFNFNKNENQKHVQHGYIDDRLIVITENGTLLYTNDLMEELIPVYYPFTDTEVVTKAAFELTGISLLVGKNLWFIDYNNLEEARLIFSGNTPEEVFFHEASDVFFVSDQTGLYLSQDSTQTFQKRDHGIINEIFDVQVANNIIWANTGKWFKSDDQGENWTYLESGPLYEGGEILTSFNDWIFLRKDTVLYRAGAEGNLWDSILVFDDKFEILATEDGLYFYDEGSLLYTQDGNIFTEKNPPGDNSRYVNWEGQLICFSDNQRFTSLNQGEDWSDAVQVSGNHEGEIALVNGELVALKTGNAVVNYNKSSDGGYTWGNVTFLYPNFIMSTGQGALPAEFHGYYQGAGFFNSGNGVLVTASNGHEWGELPGPYITPYIQAHQGHYFENLLPIPLGIEFSEQTVFAYTTEQGIFSTPIASIDNQLSQVIVTNTTDEVTTEINYQIQPNPAHTNPSLAFQLEMPVAIQINLFGVDGKPIKQIVDRTLFEIGEHNIPINLDRLPNGVYFLRLETDKENKWIKFISVMNR